MGEGPGVRSGFGEAFCFLSELFVGLDRVGKFGVEVRRKKGAGVSALCR